MIRITNVEESLAFYCDVLGMKETRRIENEDGKFTLIFLAAPEDEAGALETKSPTLELTYNWTEEGSPSETYTAGRNFGHLAYEVDNIYETCAALVEAGVAINRPPRDGRMAFIKSPDNISIELLQKGEALPAAEPWQSMENNGTW